MPVKTRSLILTALFAALTAVGAFIRIPVGPVPITLQLFFTALSGVLLGPYWGALSQVVYVVLGLIGLPIFTAGGGPAYVFNPSFGYLIGFIAGAFVIGKIASGKQNITFLRILIACFVGTAIIYAFGVPYLYLIMHQVAHTQLPFSQAFMIGFVVFLPGDAIKCVLVALLGKKVVPILRRSHY